MIVAVAENGYENERAHDKPPGRVGEREPAPSAGLRAGRDRRGTRECRSQASRAGSYRRRVATSRLRDAEDPPRIPAETDATPEGHAVDVDADGNVIGMVLVNVRYLLDRDGELKITWPEGHIRSEQLAPALAPAA
jgi:hypothetical protein